MKHILISLFLLLTVFTLSVSGSVEFKESGWYLKSVSGIEKHIDTSITDKAEKGRDSEFVLDIKIKDTKDDRNNFSDKEKRIFKSYPVRVYRRTYTKNLSSIYRVDEHLKLIDRYEFDLLDLKTDRITLKRYKNPDNIILKIGENSIIYQGATNSIIATPEPGIGDSWANSINFTYIWELDQANGWNQVEKIGENCFFFMCHLHLGECYNGVYFYDTDKVIEFEHGKNLNVFNGYFKTGNLLNATSKITGEGCTFILNTDMSYALEMNCANLYCYDTTFKQIHSDYGIFFITGALNTDIRFWGCKVNDFFFVRNEGVYDFDELIWYDSIIKRSYMGVLMTTSAIPEMIYDKVTIYDTQTAFTIYWAANNIKIKNSRAINISGYSIFLSYCADNIQFIDCNLEVWNLQTTYSPYNWYLLRDYTFNLQTTPEAYVTILNQSGGVVTSNLSDINGTLTEQVLTSMYWQYNQTLNYQDESHATIENPYTITIEKDGFKTYTQTINITEPFKCQINLIPIPFCDKWQCKPIAVILLVLSLMFISIRYKSPLLSLMTGLYLTYIALSFTQTDRVNSLLLIGFALFMLAFSFICSSSEGDKRK